MRGRRARPRRQRPRRAVIVVVATGVVIVLAVLAAVGMLITRAAQARGAQPPGVGTTLVVASDSRAAQAADDATASAEQRAAAAYLAEQPTAYWLTPERDPIGEVRERIAHLAAQAREQNASLAVVVYGLPGRDCGGFSVGGLDDADYATWTGEIGTALAGARDVQRIVLLEPDSLALAPACGDLDDRARQLTAAVERLQGDNTWIYLDAGHSDWHSPSVMADIIAGTGLLERVRGFATNVSNYNSAAEEFAYAHALAAELGGGHAVIDTSRSGAGTNGEWCNATGRLIGEPGGAFGDEVVDTNLWIKPPGESDGTCNGGPPAGRWWADAAVELTRDVR
ncbi:glycoside hydrolase family 6 protein [Microbacterium jiangjiandongii]|uniref:glycoside hydrolase family 6 protein n=1 Tax=Microbacterium jiangjiandongii TaxID=3049071 RepID=UPI00214CF70B|nr:glycoside hydrolase family 6 protein [Microbacterium sp. zg.Y843]MCR2815895.1 glycoside hydrolase family 6 protein [Microbacterium sp. zg.Y843]